LDIPVLSRWLLAYATDECQRLASSDMNKLPLATAWTRGTRDPIRDDMLEILKGRLSRYVREA
jgi:hypothetical protein